MTINALIPMSGKSAVDSVQNALMMTGAPVQLARQQNALARERLATAAEQDEIVANLLQNVVRSRDPKRAYEMAVEDARRKNIDVTGFEEYDPVRVEMMLQVLPMTPEKRPEFMQRIEAMRDAGATQEDVLQFLRYGTTRPPNVGQQYQVVPTSDGFIKFDKQTGQSSPITNSIETQPLPAPGNPAPEQRRVLPTNADPDLERRMKEAGETGRNDASNAAAAEGVITEARETMTVIDKLLGDQYLGGNTPQHPGFETNYGGFEVLGVPTGIPRDWVGNTGGGDAADANTFLKQLEGKAFLAAVERMRGTGPLSDNEGKRALGAITRLQDRNQSPEAAFQTLVELRKSMVKLIELQSTEKTEVPHDDLTNDELMEILRDVIKE
ncbi:MAG: hypothetical protein AAF501_06260 [Pseudomonadota bacterium]